MSSMPAFRWNHRYQYQPQGPSGTPPQREQAQKAVPRRPSADRSRKTGRRSGSGVGNFDSMVSAFSLNSERRARLRSAGTPLAGRQQNNTNWVRKWRASPSPVPPTTTTPTPTANNMFRNKRPASSSTLERDTVKCKRDLLNRANSGPAGTVKAGLAKNEGVLGGINGGAGWVNNKERSTFGQGAASSQMCDSDGSSGEDAERTANVRMDELNSKMREKHNSWVRDHWRMHHENQKRFASAGDILTLFRKNKSAAAAQDQEALYEMAGMNEPAAGRASTGPAASSSDYPPRPKSASAARAAHDPHADNDRDSNANLDDTHWFTGQERGRDSSASVRSGSAAGHRRPPSVATTTAERERAQHAEPTSSSASSTGESSSQPTPRAAGSGHAGVRASVSSAGGSQKGSTASMQTAASTAASAACSASAAGDDETSAHINRSASSSAAATPDVPALKPQSAVQKLKCEGNAAYQAGHYFAAIMYYNKAMEHDSHNVTLHCNRAAAHLMLCYWDKCLADCQAAVSIDPQYAKAHFRAGKALLLQYQPRAARRYYQTALQLVRQQNPLHNNSELSAMEERIETDLKAVTYVEQCRNLADQSKWSDALHAAELAAEAVKEDAMQQLRLWALIYVDPLMARVELGHLVSLTHRHIESTNEAITTWSQDHDVVGNTKPLGVNVLVLADQLTLLGKASFFSGHLYVSAASQRLKEALSYIPDHPEATQLLRAVSSFESNNREASAFYRMGQWGDAYQGYTNCLNIDPANHKLKSVTFNNRAAASLMMGNAAEALKDCTSAINEDCTNVKAYARRSHAHQDLGNLEAALRDLELAAQLNPTYNQELREAQRKREAARAAAASHSRPSSAAGSRPSSAGPSRRAHSFGAGSHYGHHNTHQTPPPQSNTNFINNFPGAANHNAGNNYYKTFGVDRTATNAVILKRYKELALKHHPDRCKDESARASHERIFKEIGEARTVLTDAKLRSDYDIQLACNSLR